MYFFILHNIIQSNVIDDSIKSDKMQKNKVFLSIYKCKCERITVFFYFCLYVHHKKIKKYTKNDDFCYGDKFYHRK